MLSPIQTLVLAFVTLIVGLVLVGQVATTTNGVTNTKSYTESINYASAFNATGSINSSVLFYPIKATEAASGWRTDIPVCDVSEVIYGTYTNSTGSVYTDPTDIVRNDAGYFYLVNTAKVNKTKDNITIFTTNYCDDGYISGWGGSVLMLVPGFFALALLGVSLALFYSLAQQTGML